MTGQTGNAETSEFFHDMSVNHRGCYTVIDVTNVFQMCSLACQYLAQLTDREQATVVLPPSLNRRLWRICFA